MWTDYLTSKTRTTLYQKFEPVIKKSFSKVGADKIWANLIQTYNKIPFSKSVNTDLTDYVTTKALDGVYKMIAIEEEKIRIKLSSRSTWQKGAYKTMIGYKSNLLRHPFKSEKFIELSRAKLSWHIKDYNFSKSGSYSNDVKNNIKKHEINSV